MSETDKSLAAHVRELVERLERASGRPWYGDVRVRADGFEVAFGCLTIRCDSMRIYVPKQPSESLACTAASAAVAKWLGENGYDAPARDGGRE